MRRIGMLVIAVLSIAIGAIGIIALLVFAHGLSAPADRVTDGERIYHTGTDASGRPLPRALAGGRMMGAGMMAGASCVDCHGEDGRGGQIGMPWGAVDAPDIRYSSLTAPHTEDGTTTPAWTDADIGRAIREGIEPDGARLAAPMPRWNLTDTELADLVDYLKELDE